MISLSTSGCLSRFACTAAVRDFDFLQFSVHTVILYHDEVMNQLVFCA